MKIENNLEKILTDWFENEQIRNTDSFLKKYSPWNREEGKLLAQKFLNYTQNKIDRDDKFSWFDIDPCYEEQGLNSLNKVPTNMHYGMPNQIYGNIDEAGLFLCLVNPNVAVEDRYKSENINEYYRYFLDKDKLDKSSNLNNFKDENAVMNHIVNLNENIISNEFNNFILNTTSPRNGKDLRSYSYYISKYFHKLLDDNFFDKLSKVFTQHDDISKIQDKMANLKICNLESFPFRSKFPYVWKNNKGIGNKILNTQSDVTLLSSRIIIRRIAKYLSLKNSDVKPYFCFRRYNYVWKNSLLTSLKEIVSENHSSSPSIAQEILNYLEEEFFYYLIDKDHNTRGTGSISKTSLSRNDGKIRNYTDQGDLCLKELRKAAGISDGSIFN